MVSDRGLMKFDEGWMETGEVQKVPRSSGKEAEQWQKSRGKVAEQKRKSSGKVAESSTQVVKK